MLYKAKLFTAAKLEELRDEQLYNFHYSALIIRNTRTMPKHVANLGEKIYFKKARRKEGTGWPACMSEVHIQLVLK